MAIRSAWERSARPRRIAQRNCAQVCRSARFRPLDGISRKRLVSWSGDWPGTGYWSTASGARRNSEDLVVIEPQVADYWPQAPQLGNAETLVLSRFAFMRRRGDEMVVESPRAGALFKICDPKIAAAIAMLSTPQQIKALRQQEGFPGVELLALLLDCQILFKVGAGRKWASTGRG